MAVTSAAVWMLASAAWTTSVTVDKASALNTRIGGDGRHRVSRCQDRFAWLQNHGRVGVGNGVRDSGDHVGRRDANGRHLGDRALDLDAGGQHGGRVGIAGDGGRNRVEIVEVDLGRIDAEGGGDLGGRIGRR